MPALIAILEIVLPVFAIIALGWAATRVAFVSRDAGRLLAEFAFKVAMPALLFRAALTVGDLGDAPWRLAIAYFGATAVIWTLASIATPLLLRRPIQDTAAVAMGATFGNTVMLGIPLALNAFGPAAAGPVALLISLETPLLWMLASLQMEALRRTERAESRARVILGVARDIVLNPIILAMLAGTALRLASLEPPALAMRMVGLLADAAVPAALLALGSSLTGFTMAGQRGTILAMMVLKMLVYPAVAYLIAGPLMGLPPLWVGVATLLAAMPVGANAYLFAARYDTAVRSISAAIAVSTVAAVISATLVLAILRAVLPLPPAA